MSSTTDNSAEHQMLNVPNFTSASIFPTNTTTLASNGIPPPCPFAPFYATLTTINSVLHSFGFTLLMVTWKRKRTPQHLYLLNLSFIECLNNIFLTTIYIGGIRHGKHGWFAAKPWVTVMSAIYFTFNIYVHFSIMFIITADRLMATVLNLRYMVKCTVHRTKVLLSSIWLLCISYSY